MRRAAAAAAAVLAATLGVSACGEDGGNAGATLTVYVSVPLGGERAEEGRAIANGARLALEDAGGRAGEFRVRAAYIDDSGGGPRWDPVAAAAAARRAAEDSTAIGFIGDLDSGATRTSLPITNEAEIVQISPGAIAADLTVRVSESLSPERYRPSDDQTFARLVPNDVRLRRAAASLPAPAQVAATPAEALAGCGAGDAATRVVLPFRERSRLGAPARAFLDAYRRRFGQAGNAAAYGYEAMALLLDAIERAGDAGSDRSAVIDEVLATRERQSILGEYSIDEDGDTTLDRTALDAVRDCRISFEREIRVPEG